MPRTGLLYPIISNDSMVCQVCGSVGSLAFIKNNYSMLKCKSCNFYFTELKVTPEKVHEIYSDSYF